jgi:hypothetical protein
MSFTRAHYDASDGNRVKRLCSASEPVAAGLTSGTLTNALTAWPAAPTPAAVLVFNAGALVWEDPRTAEQAWADVRARRDALLLESDWRVTKASDRGGLESVAWTTSPWRTYRQDLRDITAQADPFNITWPTPPSE